MSFTPFIKPYPNGYIDGEAGDTPVTAEILNTNYDGFLLALNSWAAETESDIASKANSSDVGAAFSRVGSDITELRNTISQKSIVSISDLLGAGTKIGTITINGINYDLYAPSGGGGGSSVSWNQIVSTGTKIATVTIDGVPTDVYAPTGGGSTEIIADDFDSTATYAVGDYCIYEGSLYKCTTAVTTAGDWDSSDWTETLVMDEVEQGGGGSGVDWASNGYLGAKNLNIYPYYETTHTDHDVNWTDNGDGTVTANGKATGGNSDFNCHHHNSQTEDKELILPKGTYICTGCPSGGTTNTYYIQVGYMSGGSYTVLGRDVGEGVEFTLSENTRINVTCRIYTNYTASNMKFYPMIRLAADTDNTWQPYSMTNQELTKKLSSGSGSGHTILDDDGTSLAQEDDLQFKGVYTADNSTDGVTEVNVYREMTKAEFNLLSSDEKKGFIRVTDEPDIYSDGHFQPVIYSTEEREIGVWTDGKPLYEKTIDFGTLPNNTTKTVSYNVLNVEKIVHIDAIGIASSGSIPIPFVDDALKNADILCDINAAGGNIRMISKSNKTAFSGFVTIRYTKTTDTAGSGTWTPQGVPAVHYSTDEQVIGTWFGETLYRKSYEIASLKSSAGYSDYPTNLNNIVVKRIFGDCYFSNGTTRYLGSVAKNVNGQDIEADSMSVQYQGDTKAIRIYVGKDRSAVSAIVHIEYTKTS